MRLSLSHFFQGCAPNRERDPPNHPSSVADFRNEKVPTKHQSEQGSSATCDDRHLLLQDAHLTLHTAMTAVDSALATLKENGTYDEIFQKYFGTKKQ